MLSSNFTNALYFSVFQNTSHRETKFLSKQPYFQSSIDYIEMRATTWSSYYIEERMFFRIPSCLEQLLLPNNYSLVTYTFSDQLLLEDKYFFSTATLLKEPFSRKSSYSEHVLFRSKYFFRTATFSEEELERTWKQSHFLTVLRNQLDSIYTWKDFLLTSIHSFQYTMAYADFEIPQSFVVENSKQRTNFNTECVTNVTF